MKNKGNKYPVVNGVMTYPDGREVCAKFGVGLKEYQARTFQMAFRQDYTCALCPASFGVDKGRWSAPTFDHEGGRGSGGSRRDDRIEMDGEWHNAALCSDCNATKGSRRYHWKDCRYVPVSAGEAE